eukprot:3275933-Prymnesium_polylepis.2
MDKSSCPGPSPFCNRAPARAEKKQTALEFPSAASSAAKLSKSVGKQVAAPSPTELAVPVSKKSAESQKKNMMPFNASK